jgi:serine/threonine protein phosphatase PrpC
MNKGFRIEDQVASHTGKVRTANEDSFARLPGSGVWVVADGMGGHHDGRFASQTIADAVEDSASHEDLGEACDDVANAIHKANGVIFERSQELGKQMGSTVVALLIRGTEFSVMWAGDSRAYLFRDDQLIQLTRDHTQVEGMVERGIITEEEARDHPMKHVLARAVGVEEELQIDAIRDEIAAGDLFLLCSDGLHGLLEDDEIAEVVRELGASACEELIGRCLERGAPDNVTIALVLANEPTLLTLEGVDA